MAKKEKGRIQMEEKETVQVENTQTQNAEPVVRPEERTKFCKHCGEKIPYDAVICTKCGRQVEQLEQTAPVQPTVVVNNTNQNMNQNVNQNAAYVVRGKPKNKWVAFLLCLFLGYVGAHKFYEGKIGMGILYILTMGVFGIGWVIDCIRLLMKPNPYYV